MKKLLLIMVCFFISFNVKSGQESNLEPITIEQIPKASLTKGRR